MTAPLMPKATAVWLVENTTLTFKQIADFCELHELEIQAIADGDVSFNIQINTTLNPTFHQKDVLKGSLGYPSRVYLCISGLVPLVLPV